MDIVSRVATRHLFAHLAPKDLLKVFNRYKPRLKALIQDEAREGEAKALYTEMAKELRPTAFALDGLAMQRPDEARKLKNVIYQLHRIKHRTRPEIFNDSAGPRDTGRIIQYAIEELDEALKALLRVQDRFETYKTVEQKLQHGPYTVINNYGYRPDEYAGALAVLDKATAAITKSGFGSAAYGDIVLEGFQKGDAYSGFYLNHQDLIRLKVETKYRMDVVYTLVHELGHRVWFKQISSEKRDAYTEAYMGSTQTLSVADRELFWKALVAADFSAAGARRRLPTELQELFSTYWKEFPGLKPKINISEAQLEDLHRHFVVPNRKYHVFKAQLPDSVTDYGQTNVQEDFAEVFAHYCTGMSLTPDAAARFSTATGKA